MKEKITPYLRSRLGEPAFDLQYRKAEREPDELHNDPLQEEAHEATKGLVHKYPNRALIKVSWQCAAHCRFCTRARQIGKPEGTLTVKDIEDIAAYLAAHPEIDDVILSGGDPLYTPQLTIKVLEAVRRIATVRVIRIGTRLPLQLPEAVTGKALEPLLSLIKAAAQVRPFYILVHINHPDELSPGSLEALGMLRSLGVSLLSQTVFLKGVNDEVRVLQTLFTQLYHAGVMPYYIYHCDAVAGLERFVVPLEEERRIMTTLHATLSGISVPRHVLDVEDGYGKLSVPQNFFDGEGLVLRDYQL